MNVFLLIIRRPVTLAVVGTAIALVLGYIFVLKPGGPSAPDIVVRRGAITQEVIVTGTTKPAESVDLAFEDSGRIVRVASYVGDRVAPGQTLAVLDQGELSAELRKTEAAAAAAEAKLNELIRGARSEELAITEAKLVDAKSALESAERNLVDKLQDAYTKSDDAIRTKADQWFSSPRSASPQLNFVVTEPGLEIALEQGRAEIETMLIAWQASANELTPTGNLTEAVLLGTANLTRIKSFLDNAALAVNALSSSSGLSQTTIDGYRADLSTARTNIATAIANLSAADEKFKSANTGVSIAEKELVLEQAGATAEELAGERAAVAEAVADVEALRARLARTVLWSPLRGVVTRQDAKVGEIASPGAAVVSIISESKLEIETNVPEVDIGSVRIGNPVKITFDAFPGESFGGTAVAIDPAETVIEGVVNFKVTIAIADGNDRLKSGLTANLAIETLRKEDVLLLPQFAIIENDSGVFVRRRESGGVGEVRVELGIRGQDGNVEIRSGVGEGERVLNVGSKTASD